MKYKGFKKTIALLLTLSMAFGLIGSSGAQRTDSEGGGVHSLGSDRQGSPAGATGFGAEPHWKQRQSLDLDSPEGARLLEVFNANVDKLQMELPPVIYLSIARVTEVYDFADNLYTLVELSPAGYMIYHNQSGLYIEYSSDKSSPYYGMKGDLYYGGDDLYYSGDVDVKDGWYKQSQDLSDYLYAYADYEVLDYIEYGGEYGRAANKIAGGGRSTSSTPTHITFSGDYFIQNVRSGLYLDVSNGHTSNGTQVWQWNFNATAAQQWTITNLGNGVHHIAPKHTTGKRLDIDGGVDANGRKVQIWSDNTNDAQKFRFGRTGFSGSYTISPPHSTRVLDVDATTYDTSLAAGTKVQLWQNNGGTNQQWHIIKICSTHNYVTVKVTKSPTCTATGTQDVKCSSCGMPGTQTIPAWGHNYTVVTSTTPAKCTTAGSKKLKCSRCTSTTTVTLPALGHSYTNKVCTQVATCGLLNWSGLTKPTNHFNYYMFRKGGIARCIINGYGPAGYAGHYGIDIATRTPGQVLGMPIYAQGNGTVKAKSGPEPCGTRGHFIVITYDNGMTVRYLHLQSRPSISVNASVTHESLIGYAGKTAAEKTSSGHLHTDVNTLNIINTGMTPQHLNPTPMFPTGTFEFK